MVFAGSASGCREAAGIVTCPFGPLVAGDSVDLTFVVTVEPTAPLLLTNSATVNGNESDSNSANDQDTETTDIDSIPPLVTLVDSMGDTGDGQLLACEEARVGISRLLISFSEPMQDPPGNGEVGDVTNPSSYRLVGAGPDGDLDTSTCSGPGGDDLPIAIDGVAYDGATQTATLDLNGGAALRSQPYRLLVSPGSGRHSPARRWHRPAP